MSKPGRPTGSPNVNAIADAQPSQCPACGSSERGPFVGNPVVQEFAGLTDRGNPYTHIIRRRCECANCGQIRIDRSFENRPRKNK